MITTVSIPGMHCEACAKLVKSVSDDFPAIAKTDVDLERKTVTLEHDDSLDTAAWQREIEALGDAYRVLPMSS